jgi:hypothetical protein
MRLPKGVFMKKKAMIKCAALLVLAAALFCLSTCDYFINDAVRVYNTSAYATIWAHIHYNDSDSTLEYAIPNSGTNYQNFQISFFDQDKYGEITVYVNNGSFTESTSGNIAANDWMTVIYYDTDF